MQKPKLFLTVIGILIITTSLIASQENGINSNSQELIAVAFSLIGEPSGTLSAEEVLDSLSNYECEQLIKYNSDTGLWVTHIKDKPFNNFNLKLGEGYIVQCKINPDLQTTPYEGDKEPISIELKKSWNVIGIPFLKKPIDSKVLLDNDKIISVARLDPYTKEWIYYDFEITSGMAFAVKTSEAFTLKPEDYLYKTDNTKNNRTQEMCLDIYEPVCGQIDIRCIIAPCNPITKTFPNICELKKNPLAKLLYNGECKTENTKNNSNTAEDNTNSSTNSTNNSIPNFGLCVKEVAWKQQDCFEKAKNNKLNCSVQGLNNIIQQFNKTNQNLSNLSKKEQKLSMRQFRSQLIDMNHQCKEKYKEEKYQCKADFKNSKLLCK